MTIKQATLIALVGSWIAFALHIAQFAVYSDSYLRMGLPNLLLTFASLLFNHLPLILFLTVVHRKQ